MPRTLLLLDGQEDDRENLVQSLNEHYHIIETANSEEAFEQIQVNHAKISAMILRVFNKAGEIENYSRLPEIDILRQIRMDSTFLSVPVIIVANQASKELGEKALEHGANGMLAVSEDNTYLLRCLQNVISLRENAAMSNTLLKDKLTRLLNCDTFFDECDRRIRQSEPGFFVMSCLNVDNFKVINDQYGMNTGDNVLRYLADTIHGCVDAIGGIVCRFTADRFAILYPACHMDSEEVRTNHNLLEHPNCISQTIKIRIGRYLVNDTTICANVMYDRAMMAEESIKGRYDIYIQEYNDSMRERLIVEQQIVNDMNQALHTGEFVPFLQPQYNHATGAMIGAEALVRWKKNDRYISPGEFIPIFERNGFIYELDKCIWQQVCILIRSWMDLEKKVLPISVNISRLDLYREDFFEVICGMVKRYRIPTEYLRLEVTESAFADSPKQIIDVVNQLIDYGFTVEIDDFGSGYSSLNTLKDVPASILKLDMRFFENTRYSERSGNIIESVVRMAKWLGMAVIAEGVEEQEQADFLRSIGCFYIQGFFYSMPIPVSQYEKLLEVNNVEPKLTRLHTIENLDNNEFWNPKSLDTLIFNSYVGGACIFEYYNGKTELLRVNEQYTEELHRLYDEDQRDDAFSSVSFMDEDNQRNFHYHIRRAIRTRKEASCEITLRNNHFVPERVEYVRYTMRVIATTGERHLFYCSMLNMTTQRVAEQKRHDAEQKEMESAQQLQVIMSNINGGVSAILINDDVTSEIVFNNDKYYELYGYTKEQALAERLDVLSLIEKEDIPEVMTKVRQLKQDKKPVVIDYRCRKRNGDVVYLRANSSMMKMEGYDEDVITSVVTDITEQKLLSDQLEAIVNNINGGVIATIHNEDAPEIKVVNNRYFEILGYTKEQYEQECDSVFASLHPEDSVRVLKAFRDSLQNQKNFTLDYRIVRRDGSIRWVQSNVSVMQIFGIREPVQLSVINDLTKLHEAEEKERAVADELTAVLNHAGNGITAVIMHKDSNEFLFANDRYYEIVGYSREKYHRRIHSNIYAIIHPEDRERVRGIVHTVSHSKDDVVLEFRVIQESGEIVWVKAVVVVTHLFGVEDPVQIAAFINVTKEKEANEQLQYLNDTAHDILAQPDSEKAIEDSLTKLLMHFGGDRTYIMEKDCVNRVTKNTYEICAEGVTSEKEHLQATPMEMSEPWFELFRRNEFVIIEDVEAMEDKDADVRELLLEQNIHSLVATPLFRDGALIGYVGVDNPTKAMNQVDRLMAIGDYLAILLTRRDLNKQILKEEERHRDLLDNIPCGAALYEYDGEKFSIIHINKRYWELVGREKLYTSEESILDAVYPDDRMVITQEVEAAIRQKRNASVDVRIHCVDDKYRPFHVVAYIVQTVDNKFILYTSYTPVNERTMSFQEMLPVALSTMMEVSNDFSYVKDRELRYITCSRSIAQLLNLSNPREVIGKTDFDLYDKRLAEQFSESDQKVMNQGVPITNYEEQVISKDGTIRYVNTSKYPVRDGEGNVIGIYGISWDITRTREQESQLALLTSSIPGGIAAYMIRDGNTTTLFYNDGFYRFSGYSREEYLEITNRNAYGLMFEEDREGLYQLIKEHILDPSNTDIISYVYRCHTKDGGQRWMSMKAKLAFLSERQYLLNVVQLDITEQKEIEDNLRFAEEEYRIAAMHSGRTIVRYHIANRTLTIASDHAKQLSMQECIHGIPYNHEELNKISPDTKDLYIAFYEDIIQGKKEGTVMFQKYLQNGWRWLNAHSTTIFAEDGTPVSAIISYIDVTDQYEKEAVFKQWQQSLDARADESYTLLRCDLDQTPTFDSWEGSLLPLDMSCCAKMNFDEFAMLYAAEHVYHQDRQEFMESLTEDRLIADYHRGKRRFVLEYREIVTRKSYRWLRRSIDLIERPDGSGIMAYLMFENIDEKKKSELNTRILAETDPLTGLLNRKAFEDKLNRKLRRSKGKALCAVFLLDIDNFKHVNDTYGHIAGDEVLVQMGKVLQSTLRDCDYVGRLGGDEFLVGLCNVPNREVIRRKAERICEITRSTFHDDIRLSISLGIAVSPSDGCEFEELYQKADLALYEVKNSGKNNYSFYLEKH